MNYDEAIASLTTKNYSTNTTNEIKALYNSYQQYAGNYMSSYNDLMDKIQSDDTNIFEKGLGIGFSLLEGAFEGGVYALSGLAQLVGDFSLNALQVFENDQRFGEGADAFLKEIISDLSYTLVSPFVDIGGSLIQGVASIADVVDNVFGDNLDLDSFTSKIDYGITRIKGGLLGETSLDEQDNLDAIQQHQIFGSGVNTTNSLGELTSDSNIFKTSFNPYEAFSNLNNNVTNWIIDNTTGKTDFSSMLGNGEVANFLGEVASSMGKLIPTIIASKYGGASATQVTSYLFASNYGSAYQEKINSGASMEEASRYAWASASLETLIENIGGFTPGKELPSGIIKSFFSEGLEEVITEMATAGFDKDVTNEDILSRGLYAFLAGGVSGGIFGGIGGLSLNSSMNDVNTTLQYEITKNKDITKVENSLNASLDSVVRKLNRNNPLISSENSLEYKKSLLEEGSALGQLIEYKDGQFVKTELGNQMSSDLATYITPKQNGNSIDSNLYAISSKMDYNTKIDADVKITSMEAINKMDTKKQKVITNILNNSNNVIFFDGSLDVQAFYGSDDLLYINSNLETDAMINDALVHETIHKMANKNTKAYQEIVDLIENDSAIKFVSDIILNSKDIEQYKQMDKNFNESEERVAHTVEQMLNDTNVVQQVMDKSPHLIDKLKDLFTKDTKSTKSKLGKAFVEFAKENNKQQTLLESMLKKGERISDKSLTMKFKLGDNEIEVDILEKNKLVAVHSLSEVNFLHALQQGGIISPSIAVVNIEAANIPDYGKFSIVYKSSVVDPRNEKNATYSNDIFSKRYPKEIPSLTEKGVELAKKILKIEKDYKIKELEDFIKKETGMVDRTLKSISNNIYDVDFMISDEFYRTIASSIAFLEDAKPKVIEDLKSSKYSTIQEVKDIFTNIVKESGFNSGFSEWVKTRQEYDLYDSKEKDIMTSKGRKKANEINILNYMSEGRIVNTEQSLFRPVGRFIAVTSKQLKTSKDFASFAEKMGANDEYGGFGDLTEHLVYKNLESELFSFANKVFEFYKEKEIDIPKEVIFEKITNSAYQYNFKKMSIENAMKKYGIPSEMESEFISLVELGRNSYIPYGEAKPQRKVSNNEIEFVTIPEKVSIEVIEELKKSKIPYFVTDDYSLEYYLEKYNTKEIMDIIKDQQKDLYDFIVDNQDEIDFLFGNGIDTSSIYQATTYDKAFEALSYLQEEFKYQEEYNYDDDYEEDYYDDDYEEDYYDDDYDRKYSLNLKKFKQQQLDIINETNPAPNETNVWIRKVEDIKTWEEIINEEKINFEKDGYTENFAWGDFEYEEGKKALKEGKIKIYSSYNIENGTFVSTSYQQAYEYAGHEAKNVKNKIVDLEDVAWISGDEGQYAKIEESRKYSLKKGATNTTIIEKNKVKLDNAIANYNNKDTHINNIKNGMTLEESIAKEKKVVANIARNLKNQGEVVSFKLDDIEFKTTKEQTTLSKAKLDGSFKNYNSLLEQYNDPNIDDDTKAKVKYEIDTLHRSLYASGYIKVAKPNYKVETKQEVEIESVIDKDIYENSLTSSKKIKYKGAFLYKGYEYYTYNGETKVIGVIKNENGDYVLDFDNYNEFSSVKEATDYIDSKTFTSNKYEGLPNEVDAWKKSLTSKTPVEADVSKYQQDYKTYFYKGYALFSEEKGDWSYSKNILNEETNEMNIAPPYKSQSATSLKLAVVGVDNIIRQEFKDKENSLYKKYGYDIMGEIDNYSKFGEAYEKSLDDNKLHKGLYEEDYFYKGYRMKFDYVKGIDNTNKVTKYHIEDEIRLIESEIEGYSKEETYFATKEDAKKFIDTLTTPQVEVQQEVEAQVETPQEVETPRIAKTLEEIKASIESIKGTLNDTYSKFKDKNYKKSIKANNTTFNENAKNKKLDSKVKGVIATFKSNQQAHLDNVKGNFEITNHLWDNVTKTIINNLASNMENGKITDVDKATNDIITSLSNTMAYLDNTFNNNRVTMNETYNPNGYQYIGGIYNVLRDFRDGKIDYDTLVLNKDFGSINALIEQMDSLDMNDEKSLKTFKETLDKLFESSIVKERNSFFFNNDSNDSTLFENVVKASGNSIEGFSYILGENLVSESEKGKRIVGKNGLIGKKVYITAFDNHYIDPKNFKTIASLGMSDTYLDNFDRELDVMTNRKLTVTNLFNDYWNDFFNEKGMDKFLNSLENENVKLSYLVDKNGNEVTLSKSQAISLRNSMLRQIISNKLIDMEIKSDAKVNYFGDNKLIFIEGNKGSKFNKKNTTIEVRVQNTLELFNELENSVMQDTKAQEYNSKILEYYGMLYNYENEVYKDMQGIELANDKNIIDTLNETQRQELLEGLGDIDLNHTYSPYIVNYAKQPGVKTMGDVLDFGVNDGMVQHVVDNSNKFIVKGINDVLPSYNEKIANYYGGYRTINDFERLVSGDIQTESQKESVRTSMDKLSPRLYNYYEQLFKDAIGSYSDSSDTSKGVNQGLAYLRRNFYKASLAMNLKVIATQYSSALIGVANYGGLKTNKASFLGSYAKNLVNPKVDATYLIENSEIFKNRMVDANNDMALATKNALVDNKINKFTEQLMKPIGMTDSQIIKGLYATLVEVGHTPQEAMKLCEDFIIEYQSSALAVSKGQLLRTDNEVVKMFTKFMAEPMKQLSNVVGTSSELRNINRFIKYKDNIYNDLDTRVSKEQAKLQNLEKQATKTKETIAKLEVAKKNEKNKDLKKEIQKRIDKNEKALKTIEKEIPIQKEQVAKIETITSDLKSQIENAIKGKEEVKQKLFNRVSGMVLANIWQIGLGVIFSGLRYGIDDDEDKLNWVLNQTVDELFSQMFSYMPILRDLYNYLANGYDANVISELQSPIDVLTSMQGLFNDLWNGGEFEYGEHIRSLSMSLGQFLGIPTRQLERFYTIPTRMFFTSANYEYRASTGQYTSSSELTSAISNGDTKLVATIMESTMKSKGVILSTEVSNEVNRLASSGEVISFSSVPTSFSIDGETYKNDETKFSQVYNQADEVVSQIINEAQYNRLSDSQKAKMIKAIYTYYYNLAKQEVSGVEIYSSDKTYTTKQAYTYFRSRFSYYLKQ